MFVACSQTYGVMSCLLPDLWCAYMNLDHVTSGRFVLGRDVHCEFDYWLLAVSTCTPLTKVCLQCKAAVPVRWKTCEHCDHVFRSRRKEKAMKCMRAVVSDSVKSARLKVSCIRLKISSTRPVKERQKFMSKLCIGRCMANMRESRHSD